MSASGCSGENIDDFEDKLTSDCTDMEIFNGFFNTLENNIVSSGNEEEWNGMEHEEKWNAVLIAILDAKTKSLRAELFVRIVLYFQKYEMKLIEEDLKSLFTKLYAKMTDREKPNAVERAGILACISALDLSGIKDLSLIKDRLLEGAGENTLKTPKEYMDTFFSEKWKTDHSWAYNETASKIIQDEITAQLKAYFRILPDTTDFSMFESLKGEGLAKEFDVKEASFEVAVKIGPQCVLVTVNAPGKYVKRQSPSALPMSSLGDRVTNQAYINEVVQFVDEAVRELQSSVQLNNTRKFEVDEAMLEPPKASNERKKRDEERKKLDREKKNAEKSRKKEEANRIKALEDFVERFEKERAEARRKAEAKEKVDETKTSAGTSGSFSPKITMLMKRHDVAAKEAEKLRRMLET